MKIIKIPLFLVYPEEDGSQKFPITIRDDNEEETNDEYFDAVEKPLIESCTICG